MFWIVSNYSLWVMEKTNFCILLFVIFLTSLCNSQVYRYDDYNYNEYDYNNLLPPPIPPPPPMAPMGKMTFFSSILNTTCEGAATALFSPFVFPSYWIVESHSML